MIHKQALIYGLSMEGEDSNYRSFSQLKEDLAYLVRCQERVAVRHKVVETSPSEIDHVLTYHKGSKITERHPATLTIQISEGGRKITDPPGAIVIADGFDERTTVYKAILRSVRSLAEVYSNRM